MRIATFLLLLSFSLVAEEDLQKELIGHWQECNANEAKTPTSAHYFISAKNWLIWIDNHPEEHSPSLFCDSFSVFQIWPKHRMLVLAVDAEHHLVIDMRNPNEIVVHESNGENASRLSGTRILKKIDSNPEPPEGFVLPTAIEAWKGLRTAKAREEAAARKSVDEVIAKSQSVKPPKQPNE